MKNHVWVWKEETREEGLLPEKKFCVEYKDKEGDNWKPINATEDNKICENILCQTTKGICSLGSINIDLECTNESIVMRLVPLDDQQVPRPRNPSIINRVISSIRYPSFGGFNKHSEETFKFRGNKFVLGECKAKEGKDMRDCKCNCRKCKQQTQDEIESSLQQTEGNCQTLNTMIVIWFDMNLSFHPRPHPGSPIQQLAPSSGLMKVQCNLWGGDQKMKKNSIWDFFTPTLTQSQTII